MLYNINELKVGLKVIQNKEPYVIIKNECIKPGKGQSFNRVRFKQIKSGKILEKTLKPGDLVESANIVETELIYVYRDRDLWFFMNRDSFDQISVHFDILGKSVKWMVEQLVYVVVFWDNNPILVIPPEFIKLKIIKTNLITKNISTASGNKLAVVSTGAVVKVPFFIQSGELIKVNTHSGSYISRIK
ncbi:elongation factor P (EF-P) [Candidatus Blochmanniella floridana]|uniref:Elongation factor P n=1 Tax=Blochmanniella floridana TaxID=203907 RepID=EFP_BLOFL|nr:RecName: Full=Elongation factor P; Short=EF-P [Candidatus Blochmannia floridanus]CAD83596.1 elongation factor P (EF-P) [Candidatus Blochmannia floridanus]